MKKLIKFTKIIFGVVLFALFIIPIKLIAGGAMLGAMTSFAGVNFNGEEVRDLGEIILQKTFASKEMAEFHTVVEGITNQKQVVLAGLLSKLTKLDAGCGTGNTSSAIPFTQKLWSPKQVKAWLQLCSSEFETNLLVYLKQINGDSDDVTTTQLIGFIQSFITPAMIEDAYRIAWFNDTTHSAVASGSGTQQIKVGVSITDYTMINGFWQQIFTAVAATTLNRVTITQNASATFALQDSDLTATSARDYYKSLIRTADYRLQGAPDKVIISTMSLLTNYADYLETQNVPESFVRLESGFMAIKRLGVTIIGWDFWDRTIRADLQNGTKYFSPHRAVLTVPGNLQIGLDAKAKITDLDIWYSKDTEKNNLRGKYKIDAKIPEEYMMNVAY